MITITDDIVKHRKWLHHEYTSPLICGKECGLLTSCRLLMFSKFSNLETLTKYVRIIKWWMYMAGKTQVIYEATT